MEQPVVDLYRKELEEDEKDREGESDEPIRRVKEEKGCNQGENAHREIGHSDFYLPLHRRMKTLIALPYRTVTEQPHWNPEDMLPEV